jgi:hypothetical protein
VASPRLSITLPADGYRELKAAAVHIVRAYRGVILSALVAFVAAVAWVLLVVPPFVGFGLSVASAMGWCFWLDRHPEVNAHDDRPSAALDRRSRCPLRARLVSHLCSLAHQAMTAHSAHTWGGDYGRVSRRRSKSRVARTTASADVIAS